MELGFAKTLSIDLETYSDIDLIEAGVHRYVESPAFEIELLAYSVDYGPVKQVDIADGEPIPTEFTNLLFDDRVLKTAYNAPFERACLARRFGAPMPPEEWSCTMVLAAQVGLPLGLKNVCEAMGLPPELAKQDGAALIRYFAKPCEPTLANGGRRRNMPWDDYDKWERYKRYNIRDVETENTIRKRLLKYLPDSTEQKFWALDQKINDVGVRLDLPLAKNAIRIHDRYSAELEEKVHALSGIDNVKSNAQVKQWLEDTEGFSIESLNKKSLPDVLDRIETDEAKEFLALRSELSKTSTAKFSKMLACACGDDHARGLFQFYGANRTGRFAGRLLQLQNLPQNHLEDLADTRALVRAGSYEELRERHPNIASTLSELIRTALIPEPGCQFLVADFSAIEARVIAWFAKERWRLDVFRNGGDIYCTSASHIFGVPVSKHGENSHLRQRGKVAELACIAEGSLVLTDHGEVPIEKVTTNMRVWDGVEWVTHGGVVCRGEKGVLSYGGLEATADHIVWAEVDGETRALRFADAASRGARLLQTGDGGNPIRLGGDHKRRETVEELLESLLRFNKMLRLRRRTVATVRQSEDRKIKGVPELFPKASCPALVRQKVYCCQTAVREPKRQKLQELWGPWYRVPFSKCYGRLHLYGGDLRLTRESLGAGQNRCQRTLRARKPPVGYASRKLSESTPIPRKKIVYDILNAGPRHRFTVSDVLVHNCGYGGGVAAMRSMDTARALIETPDSEVKAIVNDWRKASPNIVRWWYSMENAAKRCVIKHTTQVDDVGGIEFSYEKGNLFMRLPSGRKLCYVNAGIGTNRFGNESIIYAGTDQTSKRWSTLETYGGKLVENCVQATARDILRDAMLRMDAAGFDIRMHVHDEVVVNEPINGRPLEELIDIMCVCPDWAEGLPLNAAGFAAEFYQKD